MRRLISIPVLHTPADLGSASGFLEQEYTRRYGPLAWQEHRRQVAAFWAELRRQVKQFGIPLGQARVYQDGLPLCGQELEIVRDVARRGSENYGLVLELVEAGARLEGTEDPLLLRRELGIIKQLAAVRDPAARESLSRELEEHAEGLLQERDRFVAGRINLTLQEAEWGLLFMGLKHQVERHLEPDIKVHYLLEGAFSGSGRGE